MTDASNDQRLDTLKRRLNTELVDENGNSPDPHDVDAVVVATADHLADAPIQDFVPLLVEHQALDELRRRGLHRELDDETGASDKSSGDQ
jgi:hypothetical protein